MASSDYKTTISRFYIDVRPLIPSHKSRHPDAHTPIVPLPLLGTLPPELQHSITKYYRPSDRLMSLSSALLKYFFVHRKAKVPWSEVVIEKTPRPHGRPYWRVPDRSNGSRQDGRQQADRSKDKSQLDINGLEFNVTHQNGIIGLVGCVTPGSQHPEYDEESNQVRLGVDVACVHESGRSPEDVNTQAKLDEWVDIFGEMFSDQCLHDIRTASVPEAGSIAETMQARLRRFYALWALKEAYIKMVGEGLLADWLRRLEFENVKVPKPVNSADTEDDGFSWALRDEEGDKWTNEEQVAKDVKAVLDDRRIDDVHIEMRAYETDYLMAVTMKGVKEDQVGRWVKLDIEADISPCADGTCSCLKS